jgi:hypothetical protein
MILPHQEHVPKHAQTLARRLGGGQLSSAPMNTLCIVVTFFVRGGAMAGVGGEDGKQMARLFL